MVIDHDVPVYGGIDTHADTHHVAVCDRTGRREAAGDDALAGHVMTVSS